MYNKYAYMFLNVLVLEYT